MDASPDHERLIRAILQSPTYRLAEMDTEFLARPELRPIRLQLELLKPDHRRVWGNSRRRRTRGPAAARRRPRRARGGSR
jgi:hypothetical protein